MDTSVCSSRLKRTMDFPEEILEELLMRLPVKSLLKFKCVSKDWNTFISDRNFRTRYSSRQKSECNEPTGFTFYGLKYGRVLYTTNNYAGREELKSLRLLDEHGFVLASSKGMFLLQSYMNHICPYFYVYDLVSKKHVNIPNIRLRDLCHCNFSLGFKCKEKNTNHDNGHRLCYKVVCIGDGPCYGSYKVVIYSSETGTWKISTINLHGARERYLRLGFLAKVIGGVFFWVDERALCALAYDFNPGGRLVEINFPGMNQNSVLDSNKIKLEETKDGSLQFVSILDMAIDVWILRSVNRRSYIHDCEDVVEISRWSLLRKISVLDFGGDLGHFRDIRCFFDENNLADDDTIYLEIANQVYAYNHRKGRLVSASPLRVFPERSEFIRFELPTWPCL